MTKRDVFKLRDRGMTKTYASSSGSDPWRQPFPVYAIQLHLSCLNFFLGPLFTLSRHSLSTYIFFFFSFFFFGILSLFMFFAFFSLLFLLCLFLSLN